MKYRVRMLVLYATLVFWAMTCDARTKEVRYVEKLDQVQDLDMSASGYIYRTDGENPPVFIKLGEGNNEKFDAILENFKKENGFHDMPMASGKPESPYNIPVIGEEKTENYGTGRSGAYKPSSTNFNDGKYGSDDGGKYGGYDDGKYDGYDNGKYGGKFGGFDGGSYGLDDTDGYAPISDFGDDHSFDDDGFGPSPFKYHHDVSSGGGMKGDSYGHDDQNYFGSPYTHNEYKSPGKHHHSGGSFQKAGHYFSQGSKGDSAYKNQNEFDKGHSGKYGKDDIKGHYKKASGHSAGHANEGDQYTKHQGLAHGAKGHKFGESESHKKGQKTTGFHNVYHKDEYNKEQKFYDDAHKHGKYDKYGGKHKDYTNKDVGHKHGKHHESGYDEAHKGTSGHFNKGGYHEGHRGHSGESGHKSHNDHKAEYDTLSDNKKYGEHDGGAGAGDDFY